MSKTTPVRWWRDDATRYHRRPPYVAPPPTRMAWPAPIRLDDEARMILALDPGLQDLGWAVVTPRTGLVLELGLVHQPRDEDLHKSTDRSGRAHAAAAILAELARRHRCTAIAAEAMSFNPRRFTMALGLGMSWGAITGLAAALELELY
jgi:hypothetical protein